MANEEALLARTIHKKGEKIMTKIKKYFLCMILMTIKKADVRSFTRRFFLFLFAF
jgi:hypothetical protein